MIENAPRITFDYQGHFVVVDYEKLHLGFCSMLSEHA